MTISGIMSMSEEQSFASLVSRVRAGDPLAAEELVRSYESEIRRAIRVRLTDSRLRRLVDSIDICQSVLAGFFVRAAAGEFDIETPQQLMKLLVTMGRNRIVDWSRHLNAQQRDQRRDVPVSAADWTASPASGPVSVLISRELLESVRQRLSPEELTILEQRSSGASWDDIAQQGDEHPNTVRMRFSRALDRVSQELGLEQSHG